MATMASSCTYQESCPGLGDGLGAANSDAHQQPLQPDPRASFSKLDPPLAESHLPSC